MTNVFANLRAKYFVLSRGDTSDPSVLVWGIVMEIGYAQAIVTTVAFEDGTASVLRSTGGGFFGGGDAGVQDARRAFLLQATLSLPNFAQVTQFPGPSVGGVAFYARTDIGVFSASALEGEMQGDRHPLSPLYISGLRVLHEYLRLQKATPV